MKFKKLTNYIENLYQDYEMMSTDEFVSKTELPTGDGITIAVKK